MKSTAGELAVVKGRVSRTANLRDAIWRGSRMRTTYIPYTPSPYFFHLAPCPARALESYVEALIFRDRSRRPSSVGSLTRCMSNPKELRYPQSKNLNDGLSKDAM